ncbi:MAG: hypothetical protein Kow006_25230 [Gammaproteobacteria bacterium]
MELLECHQLRALACGLTNARRAPREILVRICVAGVLHKGDGQG